MTLTDLLKRRCKGCASLEYEYSRYSAALAERNQVFRENTSLTERIGKLCEANEALNQSLQIKTHELEVAREELAAVQKEFDTLKALYRVEELQSQRMTSKHQKRQQQRHHRQQYVKGQQG